MALRSEKGRLLCGEPDAVERPLGSASPPLRWALSSEPATRCALSGVCPLISVTIWEREGRFVCMLEHSLIVISEPGIHCGRPSVCFQGRVLGPCASKVQAAALRACSPAQSQSLTGL